MHFLSSKLPPLDPDEIQWPMVSPGPTADVYQALFFLIALTPCDSQSLITGLAYYTLHLALVLLVLEQIQIQLPLLVQLFNSR